ncbi:hypothetical protein LTR36_006422 [Oleoguttula mirabilis]|uniref:NAD(P)-binding domain-containing protein n=1 Tax=Oleoguttula mirabilis TaxID=1507867 RepID=A0AAV9JWH2_9PEZI|nr:hypothetical protein LTR36_006422 [Oleoguttula mirabilis]
MATVTLVGSTGLVLSKVLSNLSDVSTIHAFSRKHLPSSPKVQSITSSDSASWPSQYPRGAGLFISALGTTRATAGSFDNQRKIDYDLNLELAKAAKAAGTKAYVLISTGAANSASYMGYLKMKGELEDAVKALDFDHTVIVRPGVLLGGRNELRAAEFVMQKVAGLAGTLSNALKDPWAQDADVVAKAAVKAGLDCLEGREKEKVRVLTQADIVRLGRTEQ